MILLVFLILSSSCIFSFACPANFLCAHENEKIMVPCPGGSRALSSSKMCCQSNLTCPDGFVLDNDLCECTKIVCTGKMIQSFSKIQCYEKFPWNDCESCPSPGMIQNEQCHCFAFFKCPKPLALWKSGLQIYECV